MVRSFSLLFLGAAFLAQASNQHDSLDPALQKVPFDQWLAAQEAGPFRLSVTVPHAELSFHQRLISELKVTVDGKDLESRRADGRLVVLVQVTDRNGTRFQDHFSMELSKLDENVKAANLEYSFRAFFLPGDYTAEAALLDTRTGEHGSAKTQFRVPAPRHELLPDAWSDLPPVEFIGDKESPDSWYLPSVHGRLEWASSVHTPVRLNIVLNVAPAAMVPGSRSSSSRDLSALLPTLKALSQSGSPSVAEYVELLDLARRRAVFSQADGHELDWPRLKESLGEANTASIDVHSLADQHHDAQFFVSQVRKLIRASDGACVVAVLSKSVAFESGEDLDPISLEGLPACHVVYIRFHVLLRPPQIFEPRRGLGGGRGGMRDGAIPRAHPPLEAIDQLEHTLKPLNPKVFDVETPEQITKAIAEIEKDL